MTHREYTGFQTGDRTPSGPRLSVTDLVPAAQQAGEIKGGDARHISGLILSAAYGTAILSALNREGVVPALAPLLLGLLAGREKAAPRLST